MGERVLVAGSAGRHLAAELAQLASLRTVAAVTERFPDGETSVELTESVGGCEVVLLQSTAPPVNDNLMELALLLDACRRDGAASLTLLVPYFGYARSDYRHGHRTAVGARLAAELLEFCGAARIVAIDVHVPQLEACLRLPFLHLSALEQLASALGPRGAGSVVVAPDLGAVRRAGALGDQLGLPVAFCVKQRISGSAVAVTTVVGDVRNKSCIIVDDLISTGATVAECIRALSAVGASDAATVAATHGVLTGGALERLAEVGVRHLLLSDTVPGVATMADRHGDLRLTKIGIAPLLAAAVN